MTFEEFFKKKKISLLLLQASEPALFTEFENHYNQMGAKSFDHTKKYWFNQLRRRFPLPPEVKVEKLHIENQLAEQTITDSLTEASAPSVGFKPRFKAGVASKQVEEKEDKPQITEDKPAENKPASSVGFKPRFKAGITTKPAEEKIDNKPELSEEKLVEAVTPPPAVGFKPRFKASMVQKPAEERTEPVEEKAVEKTPVEAPTPPPTVGFKPRFKASMVQKPVEEKVEDPTMAESSATAEPEAKSEEALSEMPTEDTPKPVGFKPRFNMNKMKPKD